jgi:hypothetical protein
MLMYQALSQRITGLATSMNARFNDVNARFNEISARIEGIDRRLRAWLAI